MVSKSVGMNTAVLFFVLSLIAACSGGGGGGGTTPVDTDGGPNPPLIVSFTPTSGAVGASVTITGGLFGATPAENTVRLNGVDATVVSASTTQLVVEVPSGATTGTIRVITAGGSYTSSDTFTVLSSGAPGSTWTTRIIAPRGFCDGIAWNGTRFATVGSSIHSSEDTITWEERDQYSSLNKVIWGGSQFVAVGRSIYTSADGLTWTFRYSPVGGRLYDVAQSGSLWVAVGNQGQVVTSPDGITWTPRTSNVTWNLNSVVWTGSQFVAVGAMGTIITSLDGLAWTDRTSASGTTDDFTAVGATSSLIVASTFPYSGSTAKVITSTDGTVWTPRTSGIGAFSDVIYAGGKWVGVGFSRSATSTDGLTWTEYVDTDIIALNAVVYDGSQYVAAATSGDKSEIYTSPDGSAWTLRSAEQSYVAIARSATNNRLVAVGNSNISATSADNGSTWEFGRQNNNSGGNIFHDVEWSPSISGGPAFAAVMSEGLNRGLYTSTTGTAWTRLSNAPRNGNIGASDTLLVSVGSDGVDIGISTSPDGLTWTERTTTTQSLNDVFWTGSQFIAVGNGGTIMTSPTGSTWTQQTSNVTANLSGAAFSPSRLVVVGANGTIVTSDDNGVTWTSRSSGTTFSLKRAAWTGSEFVAVGIDGKVARSTDGVTWQLPASPYDLPLTSTQIDLNDLVWTGAGGRLVVVGTKGLVATSP